MPAPVYNYQTPQWMNTNPYIPQNYNATIPNFQSQQTNDQIFTVVINSPQQVDIYPVAAGNTVMLIDYEHGKLYAKTNPANGLNPIVKIYNFTEESAPEKQPSSTYASMEMVKKLESQVLDLKKMLDDLTK